MKNQKLDALRKGKENALKTTSAVTAISGKSQKRVGFISPSEGTDSSESKNENTPSDSEKSELPDVK